jgi:hypothetical protein
VQKSAQIPFVIHFFDPFTTYTSPLLSAVVRIFATSLPTSGSVMPKQNLNSPLATPGNQRRLCSFVPNRAIGGHPMLLPPPNPHIGPHQPSRLISSDTIMLHHVSHSSYGTPPGN